MKLEMRLAKERMQEGGKTAGRGRSQQGMATLPPPISKGKARDAVGGLDIPTAAAATDRVRDDSSCLALGFSTLGKLFLALRFSALALPAFDVDSFCFTTATGLYAFAIASPTSNSGWRATVPTK